MNLEHNTWYLGGPMSGIEKFNFPAFDEAAFELRDNYGLTVRSAHEVDHGAHTGTGTQPYNEYLKGDLYEMLKCDGLILLQGWTDSKGANFEYEIARDLEYPIMFFICDAKGSILVPMSRNEKFSVE